MGKTCQMKDKFKNLITELCLSEKIQNMLWGIVGVCGIVFLRGTYEPKLVELAEIYVCSWLKWKPSWWALAACLVCIK